MPRTAENTLRRLITRAIVSEAREALPDGSPAEGESDTASFLSVVSDSITSRLLELSAPGDDALSRARRTITMRTKMSEFEAIVDGLSIVVGSNSENPLRSLFRSEQEMIKAVFDAFHQAQTDMESVGMDVAGLRLSQPKAQRHREFTGSAFVFPVAAGT